MISARNLKARAARSCVSLPRAALLPPQLASRLYRFDGPLRLFIAWPGGQADIASASIIVRLPDRQRFQDNDLSLFAKEL